MPDRYLCRACSKLVTPTKNSRYRSHTDGDGNPCENSSEEIPGDLLAQTPSTDEGVPEEGKDYAKCPECTRNVKLTRLGYFEPHTPTLNGGDRCPKSGTRLVYAPPASTAPVAVTPLAADAATASEDASNLTYQKNLAGQSMAETEKILAATPPRGEEVPWGWDRDAWTTASSPESTSTSKPSLTPTSTPEPSPGIPSGTSSDKSISPSLGPTAGSDTEWPAPSAGSGASTETSFLESTSTSPPSSPPPGGSGELSKSSSTEGPFRLGAKLSETISQPDSPFLQPPDYTGPDKPEPMGDLAKELATRIKETFYAYDNRKAADNRSAQTTLGPSEIGSPCSRRLGAALLGLPPVNPGGDGWAAFVGTCGHVGMADMMRFANAGTGRYVVEVPLTFRSKLVPHGTTDCFDRRDGTVTDWKFMGAYSLKKFKLEGPSDTYRIQGQVYGLGMEQSGEKVKNIAIVGLPRAGSSLDEMHVWTEPYDRKVAEAALKRVENIAQAVQAGDLAAYRELPTGDDCRYCPMHLKGVKGVRDDGACGGA